MALNVGINVVETDGKTAPALAGAPTSVAGLIVRSRRGPTTGVVRVSKFTDFITRFGTYSPTALGAYGVDGFFTNGGQVAHVARVAGAGAASASVTLVGRNGASTLQLTAGYRGAAEPGAWGNDLYVDVKDSPVFSTKLAVTRAGATPARLQGLAIVASLDMSVSSGPSRRLRIDVDNPSTAQLTVIFDSTTVPVLTAVSRQDIVNAINAQAGTRVVAYVSAERILIVSRAKGASARVALASGIDDATRTLLGFGSTSTADGAASAATYTQVQVQSMAGFRVNDWVRLDDGISSTWLQIAGLTQEDDGTGNTLRFVSFTAPPAGERSEYRTEDAATLSTVEFDLVVKQRSGSDTRATVLETWEKLTMDPAAGNYAQNRLNAPYAGSAYLVATDEGSASFDGRDIPAVAQDVRLGVPTPTTSTLERALGADGDEPATTAYTGAFSRFDTTAVQLVAVLEDMPDGALKAVTRAGLDYCANKGDCMFVGHTPQGRDQVGAKAFGQDFRAAKVYGALYWPWITILDPLGSSATPTRVIPPTGHVLGVYARTDQTRGIWKAPAGNQAILQGALAVERDVTDIDHTDLVKNGSVNGIRNLPGAGIVVDASRTLSTDNRWLYVNVRLLFNYVKASLRDGLTWVKQEPNRDTLWNKIKYNAVTPFLMGLYQNGAFGTGKPSEVFTVIVGPENNPPSEVALGNLKVEVYFYPSRPAETILIVVGQQDSGASASEG